MFDPGCSVAVIDCTMDWPNYSNRFNELLGEVERFRAMKNEFPENPETVIITGSTSGVYEDEKWIDNLVEKTAEYIHRDIPVLGLCFGHQVIGKALGAEVEMMDSYEIGYKPIEFENSEIFQGLTDIEYPFSTHQDRITDLPENLEVIAETEISPQGIRHSEKPVYGVQFHPELTPQIMRKAIRTKEIDEDKKKRLLNEVNEPNFERAKRSLFILENFIRIAEKHSGSKEIEQRNTGKA